MFFLGREHRIRLGHRDLLDGRPRGQYVTIKKLTFLGNSFNKDKSVGL